MKIHFEKKKKEKVQGNKCFVLLLGSWRPSWRLPRVDRWLGQYHELWFV